MSREKYPDLRWEPRTGVWLVGIFPDTNMVGARIQRAVRKLKDGGVRTLVQAYVGTREFSQEACAGKLSLVGEATERLKSIERLKARASAKAYRWRAEQMCKALMAEP